MIRCSACDGPARGDLTSLFAQPSVSRTFVLVLVLVLVKGVWRASWMRQSNPFSGSASVIQREVLGSKGQEVL